MGMYKHKTNTRQEQIIQILKRDKFTTMDNIAKEVKVSVRTVRTDLAFLRNAVTGLTVRRGKYNGGVSLKAGENHDA